MTDRFYTNVQISKSNILVRGYDSSGESFKERTAYRPVHYIKTKNKNTTHKTLFGENLEPIYFDSISDAKDFIYKYEDMHDTFPIFGYPKYVYNYISENFSDQIPNLNTVSIVYFDIEVCGNHYEPTHIVQLEDGTVTTIGELRYYPDKKVWDETKSQYMAIENSSYYKPNGFPNPEEVRNPINAISLRKDNKIWIVTTLSYESHREDVETIVCKDEKELLTKFVKLWRELDPEIISGWNCLPLDSTIWTENKIVKISDIKENETLFDSKVKKISPITKKKLFETSLKTGHKIQSSGEHIFPVYVLDKEKYTDGYIYNRKPLVPQNKTIHEINELLKTNSVFVDYKLRDNKTPDNINYTLDQCYLAGLIFTDGTLKNKNEINHGFSFSQSDLEFHKKLEEIYNLKTKLSKPYKNCYYRHFPYYILGEASKLIYNEEGVKRLDVEKLSTLSYRQFMKFLSGLLDGDGSVGNQQNSVILCNYDNEIKNIAELCAWNGIFVIPNEKSHHITLSDINFKDLSLLKDKRWSRINDILPIKRDSKGKSRNINYKKKDKNTLFVQIKNIKELDETTEMIDIETNTHLFVSNGIVTHNCSFYDIPYIVNRLIKVFGEQAAKKLSPWGIIKAYTEKTKYGKEQQSYHIVGISDLDLMRAYIKFSFKNHESFSLNYISHIELGEKKISYAEFDSIHLFYLKDPQKYVEYNIQDTDLVYKIDKKTGLILQIMELAYSAGVNYEDAFTSVLFWEVKIKNKLEKRNIIVPGTKKNQEKTRQNVGAYVKPPVPGLYNWLMSLDVDSEYPSAIMQYNISPETLVEHKEELLNLMPIDSVLNGELYDNEYIKNKIKNDDLTYTINGCFFRRDTKGILTELMEEEFALRKEYKDKMLDCEKLYNINPTSELESLISKYNNMQKARKIAINAAYGATSNPYFMFFDLRIAEAITYSGQLIIKNVARKIDKYMNGILGTKDKTYAIYVDTDSNYVCLDSLVKKLNITETKKIVDVLIKFGKEKLQPKLDQWFKELADYTNAYNLRLHMKIEKIAESGLWKAKKRYALNTWWNEGTLYKEPKLSITGIEAVSSGTPSICREAIKDCLKLILNNDKKGLYSYVKEFEKKFKLAKFEDIASTSGVTDLTKYYTGTFPVYGKGTPIHVRAALLYNYYIRKYNVNDVYQDISNGDKLKYCYLKLPNPIKENIIGIYNRLPYEFGLENYIDYDHQFEAEFINPVNSIAKILRWDIVNNESILDFMI